jgi:hypothetical protein
MVAIGFDFIRRLAADVESKPGEKKRQGVGQVVARIGKQRKRPSFYSRDNLYRYKDYGRGERPAENAARRRTLIVVVVTVRVQFRPLISV